MKPPGKRLRAITEAPPPEDTPVRTLPDDLVLEIFSRADAATIVRSAACSKPLRRDILSPEFIRRVCQHPGAAACLLGNLQTYDKKLGPPRTRALFSLVHPATPAAASLSETRIAPLLSRGAAADLLGRYVPVTSRRGLLVLCRRNMYHRCKTDICVFDPFTGNRAFFPRPPQYDSMNIYALLTAADGVGSSYLLLSASFFNIVGSQSCSIQIQTVSSDAADRKWGPVTRATHPLPPDSYALYPWGGPFVLGTLIHWLMYNDDKGSLILTYRVGATAVGSIELPAGNQPRTCRGNLHLTPSPDGRLRLLVSDRFTVSIWLRLSTSGGGGWERQAMVDISSLVPKLTELWPEPDRAIMIQGSGESSGVVLLLPYTINYREGNGSGTTGDSVLVLDMETKEMQRMCGTNKIMSLSFLYEVDLASWLSAMKSF